MEKVQTIIQPVTKLSLGFRELWQYRELFYFFTWRDVKVKYKQTYLGVLWAVLQPLAMMFLFAFLFRQLKPGSVPVRYEIFALSGLILWNLFSSSVSQASDSMIQQAQIIRKIYFPRLLIPCSSLLTALFDFCFAFALFLLFCLFYRQPVGLSALIFFPAAVLFTLFAAFGLGVFLAALNIRFRDFRYTIPFLLQVLFFSAQVIYSLSGIKNQWLAYVLSLNPMNGIIELFRYPLTGTVHMASIAISLAVTFFLVLYGLYYFRKTEAYFADLA